MKVKKWVSKEVITISPEASVKQAFGLMKSLGIRHLTVVEKRIGAFPVTDPNGKLVGIITESDVLRAFVAGKK